jgi:hypothetical protein
MLRQIPTAKTRPATAFSRKSPFIIVQYKVLQTKYSYFDAFLYSLKNSFIEYHGDSGKEELNNVCPSHTVTLLASPKFSYCGSDVQDGQFRLLFHPDKLGTNINDVAQKIAEALSAAPQPEGASTLSYAARHSIKTEYTTKIVPVLEKAQKLLQNPKLEFQPGFEALGAKLKSGKDVRDDWETNLGNFATKYFEGFVDVLEREKFGEDDLLREGFEEGVPKGIVQLKLVDALKNGGYNETLLEDGALTIQVSCVCNVVRCLLTCCYRLLLTDGEQTSTILARSWLRSCSPIHECSASQLVVASF